MTIVESICGWLKLYLSALNSTQNKYIFEKQKVLKALNRQDTNQFKIKLYRIFHSRMLS